VVLDAVRLGPGEDVAATARVRAAVERLVDADWLSRANWM
jgi:hypothetical protein